MFFLFEANVRFFELLFLLTGCNY